jgi:trehalose/maltose hydrolase-like predicted phosphorylase
MLRRWATISVAFSTWVGFAVATSYETRFNGTTWDDDNWRIITTDLDQGHYQSRMSLANGYLGINAASVGPFFEVDTPVAGDNINGWPLFDRRQTFATVAGFYDSQPTTEGTNFEWLNQYGGESVISGVPHWSGLYVQVGSSVLNASVPSQEISNFRSALDLKHGILSWKYAWRPSSVNAEIEVEYEMFVHKLYVNQAAVQLKLTSQTNLNATIIDVLDGDCAVRTDLVEKGYDTQSPVIWSAVRPNGVDTEFYVHSILAADDSCQAKNRRQYNVQSIIGGNSSSIAQAVDIALQPKQTSKIHKYIGGASSTAFSDPKCSSREAAWKASHTGYKSLRSCHRAEWESIFTQDSVDDYRLANGSIPADSNLVELQITSITNPFHLLQNTIGSNAIAAAGNNTHLDINSISVCGLGSDCYAGLIFWDAEVWMAPGLVVAFPQAAKQIANYRVEKFPQAQRNIQTAYQSSQNQTGKFSPNGAVYPWTSGGFGNCTGTGPCFDYEYHLNGDIGLEIYNYYAVTGDTDYFRDQLFPIYDAVAQFYVDLVTYNHTSRMYDLYNATDPDEYANFQTNVGFTMVLMRTHINTANTLRARFGLQPNDTWTQIANSITIPVDQSANLVLEYAGMDGSISVKQADVVLIDDFLDFPNSYSLSNLDYYAGKQSLNGPGMTYGVFSIVANEISPSGCSSYTYDLYGSQPYVRGPWFQYSEQLLDNFEANGGTHPAYPFLTGMGGANRVAVFGYLGLRLMLDSLNVDPSLPPQIPHLVYRTIYWQGWPIKARSNQTHTTLTRLSHPLVTANSTFATSSIPVTIGLHDNNAAPLSLPPNGTLTLKNRAIGNIKTVPGNIAQCLSVTSSQSIVPGQFALSAVDGAASTKWQPLYANVTSSMTVSLSQPFAPISQILFDWAQAPPTSYRVMFHNLSDTTLVPPVLVTASDNIAVSNPYDAAMASEVVPYSSNTTNITLAEPVWSALFATLEISGTQAGRNVTAGATVAEWSLVAAA